ncbi:MAG: four helix bundle protein, partial [Candidatus Gracilibacteria bacterium]|nr:four helix bundle protein [Candidatus Gracilibacteria bacterium]
MATGNVRGFAGFWLLVIGFIDMDIKKIDVYQRSYRLAIEIHHFSLTLPSYLRYDLSDQMRRASRSIPSNIREGLMRNKSNKDKVNFLRTAIGSNDEILFNLDFLKDSELMEEKRFQYFVSEYDIV